MRQQDTLHHFFICKQVRPPSLKVAMKAEYRVGYRDLYSFSSKDTAHRFCVNSTARTAYLKTPVQTGRDATKDLRLTT